MADIIDPANPPGRPEKPIDWERVDRLLVCGCSGPEIAASLGIHHDTLYNRLAAKYGKGFTEYSQEKKQSGDSILREKQFEKATEKDNTMMIWLGKQRLKQKENPDSLDLESLKKEILVEFFQRFKMTFSPATSPEIEEEKNKNHSD
jgi:transposase